MRPVPPTPSHGSTPPMPSHGATPPLPARASVGPEEALVRAFYKADDPLSVGDTQFAPPERAYDIAREARISPPPQETAKDRLLGRKRKGQGQSSVWVYAPASSHISRFMMIEGESVTQIQVVFRGPEGKGEVAEYMYSFAEHSKAVSIFDQLRSSAHPYGSVLYPKVIKAGVPYAPVAI